MTKPHGVMKKIEYNVPVIAEEAKQAVLSALSTGRLTRQYVSGEDDYEGRKFEVDVCELVGARFAVYVSSGTTALHLGLLAVGVKPGDDVITVSNTHVSVGDCILHCAARPVFVDVDLDTYNLDVAHLEKALTPKTTAILVVHTAGHPVDMGPVVDLAQTRGLKVVEDAAQALGAKYKGRFVGTIGHAGIYSFVRNKAMPIGGDGGMVVTNDPGVDELVRLLCHHGEGAQYAEAYNSAHPYKRTSAQVLGFNYRGSELLAAIGRVQLKYLNEWNSRRRENAERYTHRLLAANVPMALPVPKEWALHSYLRYMVLAPRRDELRQYLEENGITTKIHYPTPLHLSRIYQAKFKFREGTLPKTERFAQEVLTLPVHPELTSADLDLVVEKIVKFYG